MEEKILIENFLVVFSLVFLMELGDKTQIASFALSARYRRPLIVFAGIFFGLAAICLLGITVGVMIREFLPYDVLKIGIGSLFFLLGLVMIWQAKQDSEEIDIEEICPVPEDLCSVHAEDCQIDKFECEVYRREVLGKNAFSKSFGYIFLAELGDKTMFSTVGLAASMDPILVFIGAILALGVVNGFGVFAGDKIAKKIPQNQMNFITGVIFVLVGVLILAPWEGILGLGET